MEQRPAKVNISAAGGSAGAGAKTCKVTLPTTWLSAMGLQESRREVVLSFDGEQITVSHALSMEDYARKKRSMGHRVLSFQYYSAGLSHRHYPQRIDSIANGASLQHHV